MATKRLPRLPSQLITLAMDDLSKVEKTPGYDVEMGYWHNPVRSFEGKFLTCNVCFAGAVMAMTLGSKIIHYADPASYTDATNNKLKALDLFRQGCIASGFDCMGRRRVKGEPFDREIIPYSQNIKQFKSGMRRLARDLKEAGL